MNHVELCNWLTGGGFDLRRSDLTVPSKSVVQPARHTRTLARIHRGAIAAAACAGALALLTGSALAQHRRGVAESELPFKVTSIIFEVTDNDIELQAFVDGNEWKSLTITAPDERPIFHLNTRRKLGRQGLSELHFASEPSHFPEDALAPSPEANRVVRKFLSKFPEGEYEFEGKTIGGEEVEGVAILSHVLPALPQILGPISVTDDPPLVSANNVVIQWAPVTTRFLGTGPVEIIGYQVIIEQVEPFRNLTIDLPENATSVSIPPEFLEPNQLYDFEVVAFEISGNSTISVGEFATVQ